MSKKAETENRLSRAETEILDAWQKLLILEAKSVVETLTVKEMKVHTSKFLKAFIYAYESRESFESDTYKPVLAILETFSRTMSQLYVAANDTANFTFLMKNAILPVLKKTLTNDNLVDEILRINAVIDRLGLHTFTMYLEAQQELIHEQQKAIMETSVPVVKLWDGILLVPLVGMLDSTRTQQMMEAMLTAMEETQARIAILDISGIPIVDSLVARHFITAANAIRLMGGDCIITGIRSRISQTLVQLGIDLSNIITRTTLADGLQHALEKTGKSIGSGQ